MMNEVIYFLKKLTFAAFFLKENLKFQDSMLNISK